MDKNIITYCNGRHCMTHSIIKRRTKFICGKCKQDKTLSNVFQYEMFIKHWNKAMKKTLKELKEFRELKKEEDDG